jgi:hypothetical protein
VSVDRLNPAAPYQRRSPPSEPSRNALRASCANEQRPDRPARCTHSHHQARLFHRCGFAKAGPLWPHRVAYSREMCIKLVMRFAAPSRKERQTEELRSLPLVAKLDLGGAGPDFVVKECFDIAGLPTTFCSPAYADAPPAKRHATVVQRIVARGGHIVGRAKMHELAFGVTGINRWTGTLRNPAFPDFIPGGSSSGSAAAVAAGLCDAAIGTDTGGSIRMPATCCGVVGLGHRLINRIQIFEAASLTRAR